MMHFFWFQASLIAFFSDLPVGDSSLSSFPPFFGADELRFPPRISHVKTVSSRYLL